MPVSWKNWMPNLEKNPNKKHSVNAMQTRASLALKENAHAQKQIDNRYGKAVILELSEYSKSNNSSNVSMLQESKAATRTLKVGSRGDDVKRLQENLNTLGFDAGKPDGVFGSGTKNAVIAFQKSKQLQEH